MLSKNLMTQMISKKSRAALLVLAVACLSSVQAVAQNYTTGYNRYVEGDFVNAEKAFKKAMKKVKSKSELARILKMIGISQYMQGKRVNARKSFAKCLKLDPKMTINANEVLDESVVHFFESINSNKSDSNSSTASSQSQGSTVKILANVKEATVKIDGKDFGSQGKELKIPAGIHELEVSAKGYIPSAQPIEVQANKINIFQVLLEADADAIKDKSTRKIKLKTKKKPKISKKKKRSSRKLAKKRVRKNDFSSPFVKKKKSRRKFRRRSKPLPMYLLPGGVGQFINNDTVLGSVAAVSQLAGLYLYVDAYMTSNAITDDTNSYIEKRYTQEGLLPENERDDFNAETVEYVEKQKTEQRKVKQLGNMGLAIFTVCWGASVVHGLLNKKAPRRVSWHSLPIRQESLVLKKSSKRPRTSAKTKFDWTIAPHLRAHPSRSQSLQHAVLFQLKLQY